MASLWSMLREEVRDTVDDFRQKGALGALRDAALDTKDLALGAGDWLASSVKDLVNVNDEEGALQAYVVGPDVPKRGSTCMLCLPDGNLVEATAVDVDGVSEPPRARVVIPGMEQPMLVPILEPGTAREAMAAGQEDKTADGGLDIFAGIKEELNSTVQEFREKGVVGAMRDAALDAVDLVGTTATSAMDGAKSVVEPTMQDFREKGAVGAVKDAALDAVDLIGNTAKSAVSGAQTFAAPLIDLVSDDTPAPAQAGTPAPGGDAKEGSREVPGQPEGFFDGLQQEWNATVNDFREKGVMGTMKDAALDAVDLVGSTANTAADLAGSTATAALGATSTVVMGARARAAPLLEQVQGNLPDLWAGAAGSNAPAEPGSSSSSTAAATREAPAEAAAQPASPASAAAPKSSTPTARSSTSSPSSPTNPATATQGGSSSPGAAAASAEAPKASPRAATATVSAPSKPKEPVPESEMPSSGKSAGRPSLVSMRRGMFEKPKPQEDAEAKKEAEELID